MRSARSLACSLLVLLGVLGLSVDAQAQAAQAQAAQAQAAQAQAAQGAQADDGAGTGTAGGTASAATDTDARARQLFQDGRQAFSEGRFDDALRLFRNAYELSPRPGLLYNIGSAADRLRHDQEALDAFERYLREAPPDAPNRAEVRGRLEVLRREQHRAPTPEQTARAAQQGDGGGGATAGTPEASGGSVLSKWWFWTIVGVVVIGAVTAGVLLATSSGGTQGPAPGIDWNVSALRGGL